MAFRTPNRKRVRIQSGHQERLIERRGHRRSSRRTPAKRTMRQMRSVIRRSREQPHWNCKTHRPSVAQVVYQFLERASNGGATKSQKSNATNQFRHLQRRKRSKRLKPDVPKRIQPRVDPLKIPGGHKYPYTELPSDKGPKSIEKCIYEVLSFGTVMGLLVPVDKEGMTFRVSSEIALFKDENKKDQTQKRSCECIT